MKMRGSFVLFGFVAISCHFTSLNAQEYQKPTVLINKVQDFFEGDSIKSDSINFELWYRGIKDEQLEFELTVRNISTDTLLLQPTSFFYLAFYPNSIDGIGDKKDTIHCIDPEKVILNLQEIQTGQTKEKNPYSSANKDVKTILVEGLVRGTVAALLGVNAEDLEEQERNDEYEWNEKHAAQSRKIVSHLDFWQYKVLKTKKIPPFRAVKGIVRFPIVKDASEILLKLPVSGLIYCVKYKQELNK